VLLLRPFIVLALRNLRPGRLRLALLRLGHGLEIF
jgi:hypothetical protein